MTSRMIGRVRMKFSAESAGPMRNAATVLERSFRRMPNVLRWLRPCAGPIHSSSSVELVASTAFWLGCCVAFHWP